MGGRLLRIISWFFGRSAGFGFEGLSHKRTSFQTYAICEVRCLSQLEVKHSSLRSLIERLFQTRNTEMRYAICDVVRGVLFWV